MLNQSISEINVLDVIPQRAPIVMINNLLHADTEKTISSNKNRLIYKLIVSNTNEVCLRTK